MKILLTGRDGQVGFELERALAPLGELVATGRAELDLSDSSALARTVRDLAPGVIVNAAAYTAVDRAESEPEAALAVNGIAPGILAEEAKRAGALLVHYSTDYVFDGRSERPYRETDLPHPLGVYGRTKLEGERRVLASGCRHLILRTSWVYAPRGRNFFLTIARKARAGEALRVVADQHGVPTQAGYLAGVACDLIGRSAEGLLHAVPDGQTTWHGFAAAIAQRLGAARPVVPITTPQYPTPARRPAYSVLANARLAGLLGAQPHWEELLDRCIAAWTPS